MKQSSLISIFKTCGDLIRRLVTAIEIRSYDRFSKAEYFRKQGAQIGHGCSIIPNSLGDEPYLVKIGDHVTIAGGVQFMTHDGGVWVIRKEFPDVHVFGRIIIGDNCVIGQNAMLFPNIKIGSNSIIGAGSVVISDIPDNSIAIGIPARVFGSVDKYREKCLEKWKVQKPPDIVIEPGKNWWTTKYLAENRKKLRRHLVDLFWQKDETGAPREAA